MASQAAQRLTIQALMLSPSEGGKELMARALALGADLNERLSAASLAAERYVAWPSSGTPLALGCGLLGFRAEAGALGDPGSPVSIGAEKRESLRAWWPELIRMGALVDAKSGENRPLEVAICWDSLFSAHAMLDLGANPSLPDRHGRDAFLIWALRARDAKAWDLGSRLAPLARPEQRRAMLDALAERAREAANRGQMVECAARCEILERLLRWEPGWLPGGSARKNWPAPIAALSRAGRERALLGSDLSQGVRELAAGAPARL